MYEVKESFDLNKLQYDIDDRTRRHQLRRKKGIHKQLYYLPPMPWRGKSLKYMKLYA